MKGFLSGARKMVLPHEDEAIFTRSSSSRSIQSQLMRHVKPKDLSQ
jgi:hypothetical protein